MNAVKAVEDSLMQMFLQNIKKFVKKFSSPKEKSSTLQLKGKFKIKEDFKSLPDPWTRSIKLVSQYKKKAKFQSGNWKVLSWELA